LFGFLDFDGFRVEATFNRDFGVGIVGQRLTQLQQLLSMLAFIVSSTFHPLAGRPGRPDQEMETPAIIFLSLIDVHRTEATHG
jgi:hypothetical protein